MATKVKPSRLQVSGTPQAGQVPVYVNEDCFQWCTAGGCAQWGCITGTLCDQTDLQGALNCKLDASALSNAAYGSGWDGDSTHAATKDAIYDKIRTVDTSLAGKANDIAVVKLTCNQVIDGIKTFCISPVVPDKCAAAVNCGTAIATEAQVYNVATSAELKCNMVCNLSGADNDHYPSAKAVADALQCAGAGDMLASVYDPCNKQANAFDYCNFINTPTIPTDNCQLANSCGYTTCTGTLVAADLNPYATCTYVNDSINSVTAYYITKNAQGDQWATYAELSTATTFYSGGVVRIPTRNDYTVVLDDENHDHATTRYSYQGSSWEYQYTINETPMTQAQLDALNSGITAAKVCVYDAIPIITDNCQIANGCGYTTCTGTVSTCADIVSALGYTPYSAGNPCNYINNFAGVTTALGYTPYNNTNPCGFTTCTGTVSTCADVISALGYTPYNSTNPNGYTTCTGTLVAGDLTVLSGDAGCVYTIKKSTTAPSGAGSNTITLVIE